MPKRSLLSIRIPFGRILAFAGTAAIILIILLWFVFSGGLDTSATREHSRPMAWALHTIMARSVRSRAGSVHPPGRFSEAEVLAGAHDYIDHCLACHGGPGAGRAPWASGLNPTPPYLLDASRRWTRAELYVIIHDGVKMSAMPAWGQVESDRQIWNTVAFLETLPKLSATDFARLRSSLAAVDTERPPSGPMTPPVLRGDPAPLR